MTPKSAPSPRSPPPPGRPWLQVQRSPRLSRGQGADGHPESSRGAEGGLAVPDGYAPCIPALGCGSSARGCSLRPRPSCHSPRRAAPSSNGRCCPRASCLPGNKRATMAGGRRLAFGTLLRPGGTKLGPNAPLTTAAAATTTTAVKAAAPRTASRSDAAPPLYSRGACQAILRRRGRTLTGKLRLRKD